MPHAAREFTAAHAKSPSANPAAVSGLYGVRYQVKDVGRSIDFYTRRLGFKLDRKHLPAFAQVSVGEFRLTLSGPGASGSRLMPDGQAQEPGGGNRVMLQVADLSAAMEVLKKAGVRFRNEVEAGPGGKQIHCWIQTGTRSSCSSRRIRPPAAFFLRVFCARRQYPPGFGPATSLRRELAVASGRLPCFLRAPPQLWPLARMHYA